MKYIGAHVSTANGVSEAPLRAAEIGAKSFALFTGNPSRWKVKPISDKEAEAFKANCAANGYDASVILPHDSFLINLGSPDAEKLAKSRELFIDEMKRCERLGLTMLNFHPGSHLNQMPIDECLVLIAESINIALN
ncbi:MAG: TIM barrel protein [Muribaculaceae bacterium]|nr:TIM barrel protein [Muribaculaceae bacterium]